MGHPSYSCPPPSFCPHFLLPEMPSLVLSELSPTSHNWAECWTLWQYRPHFIDEATEA